VRFEDVPASYDVIAVDYEARFRDELQHKPRDRELLEEFAAAVDDPVVEIGCGPGQVGGYVRDRGRRISGVDLSRAMAGLAGRRLDGAVVGDMRALPVASESAGGLLAFYSVIHLPRRDLTVALREFRRVLRPGGQLLFSAHEGEGEVELDEFIGRPVPMIVTRFALGELAAACESAGLRVLHTERREQYEGEVTRRLYVAATRAEGT
jgi:SAM-dependent methyltransferase